MSPFCPNWPGAVPSRPETAKRARSHQGWRSGGLRAAYTAPFVRAIQTTHSRPYRPSGARFAVWIPLLEQSVPGG